MSRSCQSAMSSSPAWRLPRRHPGQPAQLFAAPLGCACAASRSSPSGSRAERLLDLTHLGALQVADLEGERLDRRAHRGAHVEQLGVTVAGDDLGRRHRPQPEPLADVRLHLRDRRSSRSRRRRTACPTAIGVARPPEAVAGRGAAGAPTARACAPKVVGSAWMPWVRPDHRRVAELARRAATGGSSVSAASRSRSSARTSVTDSAVSTTSLDVSP